MKLFDNLIRAIERNSRNIERKKLVEELQDIYLEQHYTPAIDARADMIVKRLNELGRRDLNDDLTREQPVQSVSDRVKELAA